MKLDEILPHESVSSMILLPGALKLHKSTMFAQTQIQTLQSCANLRASVAK